MRWHRAGFRCYWRWKSRPLGGRPQIETDLRALIRQMSIDNPLWGAPRIHGELLKLGFEVAQSTAAKYMVKRWGPPHLIVFSSRQNSKDGSYHFDRFEVGSGLATADQQVRRHQTEPPVPPPTHPSEPISDREIARLDLLYPRRCHVGPGLG